MVVLPRCREPKAACANTLLFVALDAGVAKAQAARLAAADAHEHGDIERIETREAAIAHRFREILGHMAGGGKRREILGRRKPSKELLSRLPSRSPAWALRDLSVHRD